jgi:hypothetical protein
MRVTLPALMQDVQALTRRGVPSTSARTRWTFGFHRRLIRLCENVTALPNQGPLPQMSQVAAIGHRGYQTPLSGQEPAAIFAMAAASEDADSTAGIESTCVPESS